MSTLMKTVVATGVSSGLGFEAVKQLLAQEQPWNIILGARNTTQTSNAYNEIRYNVAKHDVTVLPVELSNLKTVRSFAQQTLNRLGNDKIDYLMLNAAMTEGPDTKGPQGSKWCESYIVNHLSQHYLLHLLRAKLVESQSRIIFVSSGVIRNADPALLDHDLLAGSGATSFTLYAETKFAQLLGAHWWRRQLAVSCKVVAVSPGLIPGTGLGRGSGVKITTDMPDAKSICEGASNILRAFTKDDFPDDPEQIFLTSWGEWWSKDVYEKSLDEKLQDKWCPGRAEIEE